jgi:hypothetical protein
LIYGVFNPDTEAYTKAVRATSAFLSALEGRRQAEPRTPYDRRFGAVCCRTRGGYHQAAEGWSHGQGYIEPRGIQRNRDDHLGLA